MTDDGQVPLGEYPHQQGGQQSNSYQATPAEGELPPYQGQYFGQPGQAQPWLGPINPLYNAPMVFREQGLDIVQSITYGFKATFARPGLWVGGCAILLIGTPVLFLLLGLLGSLGGSAQTEAGFGIVVALVGGALMIGCLLLAPHLITLMIRQVDGERLSWKELLRVTRWGSTILTYILVGIITAVVLVVLCGILFACVFAVINASESGNSTVEVFGVILIILFYVGIILIGIVVSTLMITAPYYAAEGRHNPVEAIKVGIADVRRNFWSFIGLNLLWSVIQSVAVLITFGLAWVVLVPAQYHSIAFAYRQSSRASYPNV